MKIIILKNVLAFKCIEKSMFHKHSEAFFVAYGEDGGFVIKKNRCDGFCGRVDNYQLNKYLDILSEY